MKTLDHLLSGLRVGLRQRKVAVHHATYTLCRWRTLSEAHFKGKGLWISLPEKVHYDRRVDVVFSQMPGVMNPPWFSGSEEAGNQEFKQSTHC